MKEYYRIELEIRWDKEAQEYKRDELKMHWRKPPAEPPYIVESGTDIISLADHPNLALLIEQATNLAIPLANA